MKTNELAEQILIAIYNNPAMNEKMLIWTVREKAKYAINQANALHKMLYPDGYS